MTGQLVGLREDDLMPSPAVWHALGKLVEATEKWPVDQKPTSVSTWLNILYRLYNSVGEVIYIGITNDLKKRFAHHERKQPWWSEVADFSIEFFPDRIRLEAAEVLAIQLESPRYNRSKGWISQPEPDQVAQCVSRGRSKKAAVTECLIQAIADEGYRKGDKLPTEATLCERFAVSRVTLRAALRRLADFGFVESRKGHGWYVIIGVCSGGEASVLTSVIWQ